MSITLTLEQTKALVSFYGGENTDVSLGEIEGALGWGLYAWCTEYPEEGAEFLGPYTDESAQIASVRKRLSDLNESHPDDASIETMRLELHSLLDQEHIQCNRRARDHDSRHRALWRTIDTYVKSCGGNTDATSRRIRDRLAIRDTVSAVEYRT